MDADAIAAARRDIAKASATLQKMSLNTSAAEFPPAVNHVAVKLPDFWTKEPEMWFMQAEVSFWRAKFSCSLTKYDYMLQRLPMDVLRREFKST
jgi:tRNA U38,U39,U40 pseudouridine synthase TruA